MNPHLENNPNDLNWLPMSEAARLTPYSAEYLSLLARKKKIASKKIGNVWYTTKPVLESYMKKQMLRAELQGGGAVKIPGDQNSIPQGNAEKKIDEALMPQSDLDKSEANLGKVRSMQSDLRKINERHGLPEKNENANNLSKNIDSNKAPSEPKKETHHIQDIEEAFENIIHKNFLDTRSKFSGPRVIRSHFRSAFSTKVLIAGTIVCLISLTILPVPFAFSFFEKTFESAKDAWNDANTVMGFRPGVSKNQILLLDNTGNVSIMGHIETGGQFRSHAEDGVAPIVVDSKTEVKNLNAEYLNNMHSKDFTLAFVTANGAVTAENVKLDGTVEAGKTLLVKGAAKLLSALSVGGNLRVFGAAEFDQALKVVGPAQFESVLTAKSDVVALGNLSIQKNASIRGGLEVGSSLIARSASFRSLGVADGLSAKGEIALGSPKEKLTIDSKKWSVDEEGQASFDSGLTLGGDLSVGGSSTFASFSSLSASTTNSTSTNAYLSSLVADNSTTTNAYLSSLIAGNASIINATSTNFFADHFDALLATISSLIADDISVGALSATNSTTTHATTTNLYSSSLIANNATTTNAFVSSLNLTGATSTDFFSTNGTFDNLYVNTYEQNNGTFAINSSVSTGNVFSVLDTAITTGTLIHQSLTANAGNGELSKGQVIDLTDSTTAGGGFSAFTVNLSGSGTGTGNKYLLDLNPGTNKEVVFDSSGVFRPTTSAASNTNSIGSPSFYWKNGYFDTLTANNLSGTVISGATSAHSWTIGSEETGDLNEALVFQRNSGSGNATLEWNRGANDLRYLSVNYPFNTTYTVNDSSIGTGINLYSGNLTNNTTGGTQKLLSLTNTGTGTTEHAIYVDNTGTGVTAMEIAGNWTNGLIIGPQSGNVGIGITNPNYKLEVNGVASTTDLYARNATTTNATSTNFFSTRGSFTNLFADTFDLTDFTFVNATGTNSTTTNSFATTASSTNLYSSTANIGSISSGGITPLVDNTYDLGSASMRWKTLHIGPGSVVVHNDTTNTLKSTLDFSGSTARLITDSATPLQLTTGANVGLNISTAGNVGVGTTTPSAKLAITGTSGTEDIFVVASSTNARLLTVTSAGNVGIGTSNPVRKLTIDKSSNPDLGFYTDGTERATLRATTANLFQIDTGGSTRMTIDGSGNVGIGTTAPNGKLDVRGDIYLGVGGSERLYAGSGLSYIEPYNTSTGDMTLYGTFATGDINFNTANSATPKVKIQYNGNVGIGNTNPGTLLDIGTQGTTRGNMWLHADGVSGAYTAWFSPNGSYYDLTANDSYLELRPSGVSDGLIVKQTSGDVSIGTTGGSNKLNVNGGIEITAAGFPGAGDGIAKGAAGELGIINSGNYALYTKAGNVGIGTTVPGSYKLNVNGNTNITGTLNISSTATAASFSGAGTGLTGTASSLTAGTANAVSFNGGLTTASSPTFAGITLGTYGNIAQTADSYGTISLGVAKGGYYGIQFGQSTTNSPNLMYDAAGNGGLYSETGDGWINYYTNSTNHYNMMTATDLGYTLGVSGTIGATGAITASSFSGSGASLTSLNASNLSSGIVATARLGSGTANATTFLRGDQTWATISVGGDGQGGYLSADQNNSTTADVYYTVIYNATEWGSGYLNTGTGVFTIPAGGAGKYILMAAAQRSGGIDSKVVKNSSTVVWQLNTDHPAVKILDLAAGDTLQYQVRGNGGSAGIVGGSSRTYFHLFRLPSVNGADVAEYVRTNDSTIGPGDLVSVSEEEFHDGDPYNSFLVEKADSENVDRILGIISPGAGLNLNDEVGNPENSVLITLAGRVPIKVTEENGPIHKGDYLTVSPTKPGYSAKAIKSGMVFAQALENSNGTGEILAFIVHMYYEPNQKSDLIPSDLNLIMASTTEALGLNLEDASAGLDISRDVIIRGALKVDHIGSIGDLIALESDVEFIGRPYFNSDTGGVAIIEKGSRQVDVKFERAYSEAPVISASVTLNASTTPVESDSILAGGADYVVTNRSGDGFSILLANPAPEAMQFSWIALAIKNLRISNSADTLQPGGEATTNTSTTNTDGTNASDTNTTTSITPTTTASSTPTTSSSTSADSGTSPATDGASSTLTPPTSTSTSTPTSTDSGAGADTASSTPATTTADSGASSTSTPTTIPTSTESGVGTPTSSSVGADTTTSSSTSPTS